MTASCTSLEEVRENIDRLDRQIVTLLAERGTYVTEAARFKKDSDAVRAPQRVEQVMTLIFEENRGFFLRVFLMENQCQEARLPA